MVQKLSSYSISLGISSRHQRPLAMLDLLRFMASQPCNQSKTDYSIYKLSTRRKGTTTSGFFYS